MCGYFCIGFIDFRFAGKTLTDFTSLFSAYDFGKITVQSCVILKMDKVSSNLSDQTKLRLNEFNKINNYFNSRKKSGQLGTY